jgi:hypothetical protein
MERKVWIAQKESYKKLQLIPQAVSIKNTLYNFNSKNFTFDMEITLSYSTM